MLDCVCQVCIEDRDCGSKYMNGKINLKRSFCFGASETNV